MDLEVLNILNKIDFSQVFIYDDFYKRNLTYNDFFRQCILWAEYIEQVVHTDSIVVIMENSYELSCLYFAIMMTSKKMLVIDPQKGSEEINNVISTIKPTYMIKDENLRINNIKQFFLVHLSDIVDIYSFDGDIKAYFVSKIIERSDSYPYLVTYTSGTSGVTKGVEHTLKNLFLSALALDKKVVKAERAVFLHVMPMSYMAGILNSLIYPFLAGAAIVLTKRFSIASARSFWNIVAEYSANLFWLSPTMLTMIEKLDRDVQGENYCKNNTTVFLIGTAALVEQTRDKFNRRYGVNVFASYGLSETLFISVETKKSLKASEGNSVGELLDGVNYILNENEILLDVPWMFLGYTNENTPEYFYNKYYRSGDLANVKDGNLYITGRKKDLIIKGGMNYSPLLIENVILENLNSVQECVVIGVTDIWGEEKICCVYICINCPEDIENDIRNVVLEKLGKNYYIDYFWRTDFIARNVNGKIDRNYLQKSWEKENEK